MTLFEVYILHVAYCIFVGVSYSSVLQQGVPRDNNCRLFDYGNSK